MSSCPLHRIASDCRIPLQYHPEDVPEAVGVPLITPLELFNVRPAGNVPTVTDQAIGLLPPVDTSVWLYAIFTVPSESDDVVIDSALYIVIDRARLAVAEFASVTCAVKLYVPATVGVPLIAPVVLFRPRPDGREPDVNPHVYGVLPPDAESVWLYAALTVPSGNDDVVTERPLYTWIVSPCVATPPYTSCTCTVNEESPEVVGVPETAPVAPFSVIPAGRLPEITDQTYGVLPPVAASVAASAPPTVPSGRADVVIATAA